MCNNYVPMYRHPIPDYYSITLEISRARTTSVRQVTCDWRDRHRPTCPQHYRDGDQYSYRTPNDACSKLVCLSVCLSRLRSAIATAASPLISHNN